MNIMLDNPAEVSIADALAAYEDRPFYPLTSEGMPPPGPDFIAHALALGDPVPVLDGKKANSKLLEHGPILEKLYRRALYDRYFSLPVKHKGRWTSARFLPGHRWGEQFTEMGPAEPCTVMVIGKCLGQDEVRFARNFCGKSGTLFREVLTAAGLEPGEFDNWYIANLIRHANLDPTRNQLAKSWIRNCAPLLEQELRLLKPKFVICLGAEATSYMLGGEAGGHTESHGRILKKKILVSWPHELEPRYHEIQYITCLHPAHVLHVPDKRPDLQGTIKRFVQLTRGELSEESILEQPNHEVIWTEERLKQVIDERLEKFQKSGKPAHEIAIDLEWHGEFWSSCGRPLKEIPDGKRQINLEKGEPESWVRTFQFTDAAGHAWCVVLRHGGPRQPDGEDRVGTVAFVPSQAAALAQLKRLLVSTPDHEVRLIGQHLRSDLPWICQLDRELGEALIQQFDPPPDDPDPDGVTRLYGWQKVRQHGGFDTMYAMHAVQETAERKLEIMGMNLCGIRRYDGEVQREKKELFGRLKIKPSQLPGYGELTDRTLHHYANWDVDTEFRLYQEFVRPGGKLDRDQYGRSSWLPFWLSQGKLTAELEMEMTGLRIDTKRAEMLTSLYHQAHRQLLTKLQQLIGWPEFNPNSVIQVRTVLFGPDLAGKINNETGEPMDPRPPTARGCKIFGLEPVKTSGKPAKNWWRVKARNEEALYTPSVDKETLGILFMQTTNQDLTEVAEILKTLRWYRFVNRVITGVLCPPDGKGEPVQYDEDGDMIFEKGVMASVEWDRCIRTHFLPVDTARVSSSRPNVQNFSKRREKDLKDILQSNYVCPLRSIVVAPPGYVLVEADGKGAELLMMAIQSGSQRMVDHCQRAELPESDPRHYDIHSRIAKIAFDFDGPPLKGWLEAHDMGYLRDITKTVVFGLPYGRGDDAVVRAVEEQGRQVLPQTIARIREAIFGDYNELPPFFQKARARPQNPGWMTTCFGYTRRFQAAEDEGDIQEMERIAGNLPIQGGVAGYLIHVLRHLRHYSGRYLADGTPRYVLNAQIHDAVMAAVRIPDLRWYLEEVLPHCMGKAVTIYACDFDGVRLPGRPGYHMGHEWAIYEHWGEKLTRDRGLELGISEDFLPKPKK